MTHKEKLLKVGMAVIETANEAPDIPLAYHLPSFILWKVYIEMWKLDRSRLDNFQILDEE